MNDFPIVVVGTGFSGIAMGVALKGAGIDSFVILEKAGDVGGTWRDNTYPGAACDVPSHLYCFSFEPKPDWSRAFSPQQEIHAYLEHCVEKYDLAPHIRFHQEVTGAEFDEASGTWTVRDRGRRAAARARGRARERRAARPRPARHPGPRQLRGRGSSTPRSGTTTYELAGKRVAVIGTGATRDPVRARDRARRSRSSRCSSAPRRGSCRRRIARCARSRSACSAGSVPRSGCAARASTGWPS